MKLYCLYDKKQNKLIAIMQKEDYTLGAIDCSEGSRAGNYIKEIVISLILKPSPLALGLVGWLDWVQEELKRKEPHVKISKEFPFDVADVEIRELSMSEKAVK